MHIKNNRLVGADNRMVPMVNSPNHGGKLTGGKPRFLVIHYTAGATGSGAVSWFKNASAGASAHFVIGHDGAITQMLPLDTVGWHAGRSRWKNIKGLNSHSIGIEIANWGKLQKSASGGWLSYTGKPIPDERVVLEEHRHAPGKEYGWEIFDEAQMSATVDAAKAIVQEYDMKPWDLVGHDDISPIRKVDPGPAFYMDAFRARVFGRSEDDWDDLLYKVRSGNGLNLRTGPSPSDTIIANLADNAVVHVIEKTSQWWLVAEVIDGDDDRTGYVHSHWLEPA